MKTISLIIPIYNEGGRIYKLIDALKKGFSYRGLKLTQVIFSNDGSTDNTLNILKKEKKLLEAALHAKVHIVTYSKNKGRGYAIRYAGLIAKGDYVLYADADFSIPLSNIPRFIPYMNQGYDLLYGSKKIPGAFEYIKRSLLRRVVGYGHSVIASLVLGVFAWDYQGGFKLFSQKFVQEIFPLLTIDRWGFDMEVIFAAKKFGYKTIELPIHWGHIESDSKVKLIRDIYRSLTEMVAIRINWFEKKNKFASFGASHQST